jgi:two-component system, NarL family, invasion response regulator UvrY
VQFTASARQWTPGQPAFAGTEKKMNDAARSPVSVLLVDDHAVVREGYSRLLERHGDIKVIGEAGDAATAHSLFCCLDPQIVVMDISMPGTSGIEAMRRMLLFKPEARVLVFSMHEDVIFVRRALQAGAFGYVTKASAPNVLVQAIHTMASGKRYLSPEIAQKLALRDFATDKDAVGSLSAREFEVLRLLTQGQSIREIAQSLGLNAKTVANHQSVIKQKLGAESAIQLLTRAGQLGLVTPE